MPFDLVSRSAASFTGRSGLAWAECFRFGEKCLSPQQRLRRKLANLLRFCPLVGQFGYYYTW